MIVGPASETAFPRSLARLVNIDSGSDYITPHVAHPRSLAISCRGGKKGLLANRIFVLSSQKQLGINLQTGRTLFERTPLPCHEAPTQQGRGMR